MAQLDTGTISGTVTDQSGGAIPGAAITIRNVETGVARSLTTNAAGRYEAAALPVGNYEVRASLTGFQTLVRSGITLTVGRNAVVDMALQVGEVAQSVTVTGEASFVETTTATVSNLVDEKRVTEIPLNNRDLTGLAFLQPGVLRAPLDQDIADTSTAGSGSKLSVAGGRATYNTFLLDGVSNADTSGNVASVSGAYEGAETIQEFQIITNNYSAEYSNKPGAIISAVTKSGTNAFHGSLYEFLRN
ncbi:MAG: carboxypeptidase regulatory-like domain-containing protein, partial [Terriglobia bacterium]